MKNSIEKILGDKMAELGRPDLYRQPIMAVSSAADKRYEALKEIIGTWNLSPEALLPGAKSVISYFVPFTKEVTDGPKNSTAPSPLWAEAYEVINKYFGTVNQAIVAYLTQEGHKAASVIVTYSHETYKADWSHKSAAAIAGLGSFGINRILITEKGSSGRYGTVLTTAALPPNETPSPDRCRYVKNGSCGLCLKACPPQALSPTSFNKNLCAGELDKNKRLLRETTALREVDVCGKCISVCPVAYIS